MLPLILLPGMGGDARMFRPQLAAFANAAVPAWIEPQRGEGLATYAARMARAVDPGGPCFVAGASFGGMVALEMTGHLSTRACFLIGSIRAPRELPRRIRILRPWLGGLAGRAPELVPACARTLRWIVPRRLAPATRSMLEQLAATDRRFFRWAALAVLRWEESPERLAVPVLQIHGTCDRILPHRLTRPDVLVPGAGHLLSMTHGEFVNEFLRAGMRQYGPACVG
jgi:pimeloyl-ACP methyl ester carboxylesterase